MKKRSIGLVARLIVVGLGAVGLGAVGLGSSAGADVSTLRGGAFGHYTKVGLFGGPAVPVGPLPDVRLPATGGDAPLTAKEAAGSAVYGPAHIFGGVWPADVDVAPPSGPITVTTKGTAGKVTSSVDIVLRTPRDRKSPGGFGPLPPTQGDELHSTCTATDSGATGSTRFVNATMSKATTSAGEPTEEEKIPDNPPVNYTRTGVLTNVGDRYKIVYNEQFVDPDGSITVNAVHMYLLGDIAVGESIIGQVRCSSHGAAFADTPPSVAAPPDSSPPGSASPVAGAQTTGDRAQSGSSPLPVAVAAVVLVTGGGGALAWNRRRRRSSSMSPRTGDP